VITNVVNISKTNAFFFLKLPYQTLKTSSRSLETGPPWGRLSKKIGEIIGRSLA
jgi:hypothetical protein